MNSATIQTITIQDNLLGWAIVLAIGFPFLVILLGEFIHRLKRRGKPIATTLRLVRNLILPVLVFLLFMQHVLGLDTDGRWGNNFSFFCISQKPQK